MIEYATVAIDAVRIWALGLELEVLVTARGTDAKRDGNVVVLGNGHVENPLAILVCGNAAALLDDECDRGGLAHEMDSLGD